LGGNHYFLGFIGFPHLQRPSCLSSPRLPTVLDFAYANTEAYFLGCCREPTGFSLYSYIVAWQNHTSCAHAICRRSVQLRTFTINDVVRHTDNTQHARQTCAFYRFLRVHMCVCVCVCVVRNDVWTSDVRARQDADRTSFGRARGYLRRRVSIRRDDDDATHATLPTGPERNTTFNGVRTCYGLASHGSAFCRASPPDPRRRDGRTGGRMAFGF